MQQLTSLLAMCTVCNCVLCAAIIFRLECFLAHEGIYNTTFIVFDAVIGAK